MKCSVKQCNCDVDYVLGKFDDGAFSMTLCPNHQIMYILGLVNHSEIDVFPSEMKESKRCTLCTEQAIHFIDHDATYELCSSHMEKLIRKNLAPYEFSVLVSKHGRAYLLHDDFYGDDGEALQPVE